MGANGAREGTWRYEIGNTVLVQKKSLQIDCELDFNLDVVSTKLNLFATTVVDSNYLQKISSVFRWADQGFQYNAGNTRLIGGKFHIDMHPNSCKCFKIVDKPCNT